MVTREESAAAHNAVAAVVEMYTGIIRAYDERERILTSAVGNLQKQVEQLSRRLHSANPEQGEDQTKK